MQKCLVHLQKLTVKINY